jgi:peptidoglycan/LPS O-acetylase OafA/YrhL
MDWLFEKLGMVFMVLSVLLALETYVLKIKKSNLFLKVGQSTLSIYIIHMIVLYGSLTGRGLTHYFHDKLNAYQIVPYTLLFVLAFVTFAYFLDQIRNSLSFVLVPLKKLTNRLFLIFD